ncbi:hypothetical protein, partial [Bradyrhizobium sp. SZCCHNPS1003]|uniref:hypothetical protein n=2 Tax=Bradyrhizobium TaxID=374 RepID=UPI0039657507
DAVMARNCTAPSPLTPLIRILAQPRRHKPCGLRQIGSTGNWRMGDRAILHIRSGTTQLSATAGTDSAQGAFSPHQRNAYAISTEARPAGGHLCMKNFSDASFSPDVIALMTEALNASVAALPEPVSSTNVNLLAEAVLRAAKAGERDVTAMQRLALLELQIMPRM